MLAHFKLSDFLLDKLNAVVLAQWPTAKPAETYKIHFRTAEMSSLFVWHLDSSPTPSGSAKHTSLQVKMSPLSITMKDGSHFELTCEDIQLEYTESITTQLVTVGGPVSTYAVPISIADLQLAHEFEKRLIELKAQPSLANAA